VPETKVERILFALGLLAIAGLGAVVVSRVVHGDPTGRPSHVGKTAEIRKVAAGHTGSTNPTPPHDERVRLRLTALLDTWISVRRGSRQGVLLFQGRLKATESETFTATSLFVRFGAAGDITARLNGKPLPLPDGTYGVDISSAGLGARSA
jgi:hypothetical protein